MPVFLRPRLLLLLAAATSTYLAGNLLDGLLAGLKGSESLT